MFHCTKHLVPAAGTPADPESNPARRRQANVQSQNSDNQAKIKLILRSQALRHTQKELFVEKSSLSHKDTCAQRKHKNIEN